MDDQRLNLPRYYLSYWTYTCPFFHGKLLNLLIDEFLILTWFLNSKEGNQPDFTLWLGGLLIHCLSCKLNHYWTNQIELGKAYSRSLWIKERRKERWMRQNRTGLLLMNLPLHRYDLSYWTYTCPFFHGKLLNLLIESFSFPYWFFNSKEGNQPDFTLSESSLLNRNQIELIFLLHLKASKDSSSNRNLLLSDLHLFIQTQGKREREATSPYTLFIPLPSFELGKAASLIRFILSPSFAPWLNSFTFAPEPIYSL